ncbi:MAG: prolipoprotein diacylglyceryl transferase [Candidatus Promineofilum sp.]|nr:prolipoprotein diacylglyceryl transferase [Promineifilum sp.]
MRRAEPYWYAIIPVLAALAAVLAAHWLTGFMPSRSAVSVGGFAIYWYAVCIITGVALGAWVVARLAAVRARAIFDHIVPTEVRARPLAEAALPDDVTALLTGRKLITLGEALYNVGLDPRRLGLKRPEQTRVVEALAATPGVDPVWTTAAPWRIWNPDHVWGGLTLIVILGLIGARLYHIMTPSPSMAAIGIYSWRDYIRYPLQLLNFRAGGLGIYGAMAGGMLAVLLYTRRNRIPTLAWADLAVVGMALGQAVGRWGNFFNQELYGRPTNAPWAITIDPLYRLPDFAEFSTFHPAFLYESLWSLLTFFVLLWLARRRAARLLPGELLALYLVAYAIGRSLLELVRLDSRAVPFLGLETGLAVATVVSLLVAAVAAVAVVVRRLRVRSPAL